jgi:hypothetical protein
MRCIGHSTIFLTSSRPTNLQRGTTRCLPTQRTLRTYCIRPHGGRGRQNVSFNGFLTLPPPKIVFLGPRRSESDETGSETACNTQHIDLVDHSRVTGGEIWGCRAVVPQFFCFSHTISRFLAIAAEKNVLNVRIQCCKSGNVLVGPISRE